MSDLEHADRSGKEFEQRVVDIYRELGYQVTHDAQLEGFQTDLIARKDNQGAATSKLVIECKDWADRVGNRDVGEFVSAYVTQRPGARLTGAVMVAKSGFTAPARAAVEGHQDIALLSLTELSARILDVRNQARNKVNSYRDSDIYRNYLALRVEGLAWGTLTPTPPPHPSIGKLLGRWKDQGETPSARSS